MMVGRDIIYNNFSPQEINYFSKLQIQLLSRYLMETFEVINSILAQSEKMVIKLQKKIINPNSNNKYKRYIKYIFFKFGIWRKNWFIRLF